MRTSFLRPALTLCQPKRPGIFVLTNRFVAGTRLRIFKAGAMRTLKKYAAALCAAIVAGSLAACSSRNITPAVEPYSYRQTGAIERLTHQPPTSMQLAFLMTDGSVLAQSNQGNTWYKYVPDASGSYKDGTWSQAATLPSNYAPSAFASAVLADGRLVISGGEYNVGGKYQLQLTNLGAIYDPKANTWTPIGHPAGWAFIGDSPSSVLPNGLFFVGQKLTERGAVFDEKTMQWTEVSTSGKADFNAEEGFTLLPDGTVLTADVKKAPNSERYDPSAGKWTTAGSTIVDLHSPTDVQGCIRYGPKQSDCYYPPGEIGPAMLRPDGTVFATGSGSGANGNGPGHTSIFHTSGSLAGSWTAGPNFPNGDNAGDSFSVLLPSGNVLVFGVSGALYEFNGTTLTQTGTASGTPVLLPTGQVMMIGSSIVLYTPSGKAQAAWAPHISAAPSSLSRGGTYTVSGTQFNGLSQAMAFGDEFQNATNYPLVRLTNTATKHVFYARTHDHSSMGVATGSLAVSTHFDVPASAETGASTLQVVANGIPSAPVNVTVH